MVSEGQRGEAEAHWEGRRENGISSGEEEERRREKRSAKTDVRSYAKVN